MSEQLWNNQFAGFQESLRYIKGRKEGIIKSLKTPWVKFNEAGTDGLEWGSLVVIGARPGVGKTTMKDQIIREAFKINVGEKFRVLEFSLEMLSRVSAIREYSSHLGKSYKYLCSAEGQLTQDDLDRCISYATERIKNPVDVVEEPCTVNEFRDTIKQYMETYKKDEVYTNTVVTLDHSILLKMDQYEKNKLDMLYNLGEVITQLKRRYPIIFIVLSQLNRDINRPERNEDGKYGNYVLDSDIFGSDGLLQHAELVIGLNRPGKQRIRLYGPDRYIIDNDRLLVMHFLKCRNGSLRMSFFDGDFEKMTINECATPPQANKK